MTKRTSGFYRGIAIIMVIASHYAGWMRETPRYPVIINFISEWGVFGVDLFFMLSGYGLVKSISGGPGKIDFWVHRLKACYLPYLIVAGLLAVLEGGSLKGSNFVDYLTGKDYWYIQVQMVLYLLFFVCFLLFPVKQDGEKVKCLAEMGGTVLLSVGVTVYSYWLFTLGRAPFWVLSNGAFLVGVYLAQAEKYVSRLPLKQVVWKKKRGMLSVLFLLLALGTMGGSHFCYKRTLLLRWEFVGSMAFTCGVVVWCVQKEYRNCVLELLGRYSIYLYLVHGFIYRWMQTKMGHCSYAVMLLCTIAVTLLAGGGFGYLLEWGLHRGYAKIKSKDL